MHCGINYMVFETRVFSCEFYIVNNFELCGIIIKEFDLNPLYLLLWTLNSA